MKKLPARRCSSAPARASTGTRGARRRPRSRGGGGSPDPSGTPAAPRRPRRPRTDRARSAMSGRTSADDRRDDEAGDGRVGRQAPITSTSRASRPISSCASRSAVAAASASLGLGAAAGKADLAGVVVEVVGALRQQHREPVALHQRHQHRGVRRLAVDEAALDRDLRRPERAARRSAGAAPRPAGAHLDRRQVVVDAEDRQVLRVEARGPWQALAGRGDKPTPWRGAAKLPRIEPRPSGAARRRQASFSLMRADLPERSRR